MVRFSRLDEVNPHKCLVLAGEINQCVDVTIAEVPVHATHHDGVVDTVLIANAECLDRHVVEGRPTVGVMFLGKGAVQADIHIVEQGNRLGVEPLEVSEGYPRSRKSHDNLRIVERTNDVWKERIFGIWAVREDWLISTKIHSLNVD